MDALMHLESVLRSKQAQLTPQEVNVLQSWRDRAERDLSVGGLAGSVTSWLVTKRLDKQLRILLSAGAGSLFGLVLLNRSIRSSVDYMLSLQGTRVQGELAHIILRNNQSNGWAYQCVSKYFYPEVVFVDSSVDKAFYRWRYRNLSGDAIASQTQSITEANSNEKNAKMITKETEQVYASAGSNTAENPFDVIFGLPENTKEVSNQADAPKILSRRQTRKKKRLHRRHRHGRDVESEI
ncbi:hypothetical protein AAHA92_28826 [Salvia divinorum]|uniref:Uncharacterized protein n=1 Tax=Salvia divinorum TaxID=28513 RepID=A0ABD1FWA3_SALDI